MSQTNIQQFDSLLRVLILVLVLVLVVVVEVVVDVWSRQSMFLD